MRERWAIPPKVYAIEERSKVAQIGARVWDFPVFVLDQDGIDRIRLGYVCIACLQCHEQPHPEKCSGLGCGFPMRRFQDEIFAEMYVGEVNVGWGSSDEDELEMAKEEVERQRRGEPSLWLPSSFAEH